MCFVFQCFSFVQNILNMFIPMFQNNFKFQTMQNAYVSHYDFWSEVHSINSWWQWTTGNMLIQECLKTQKYNVCSTHGLSLFCVFVHFVECLVLFCHFKTPCNFYFPLMGHLELLRLMKWKLKRKPWKRWLGHKCTVSNWECTLRDAEPSTGP